MKKTDLIVRVLGALLAVWVSSHGAQAQTPQQPAAAQDSAAAPAPVPGTSPDPKIIEGLMECIAEGLPEGWKKTWFVIKEIRRVAGVRQYEAKFYYATETKDRVGKPLQPCGTTRIVDGVLALNAYLQPSQRRWTSVTMTFNIDSSFDATYDFTEPKPDPADAAPAKAAPKPAAKKKQETAK